VVFPRRTDGARCGIFTGVFPGILPAFRSEGMRILSMNPYGDHTPQKRGKLYLAGSNFMLFLQAMRRELDSLPVPSLLS
jgi:hypothetical protein